jgi:hypothetical protein
MGFYRTLVIVEMFLNLNAKNSSGVTSLCVTPDDSTYCIKSSMKKKLDLLKY